MHGALRVTSGHSAAAGIDRLRRSVCASCSAKRFALIMRKLIEKGDSFIVTETARLQSLLDDPSVAPAQVRTASADAVRDGLPAWLCGVFSHMSGT